MDMKVDEQFEFGHGVSGSHGDTRFIVAMKPYSGDAN